MTTEQSSTITPTPQRPSSIPEGDLVRTGELIALLEEDDKRGALLVLRAKGITPDQFRTNFGLPADVELTRTVILGVIVGETIVLQTAVNDAQDALYGAVGDGTRPSTPGLMKRVADLENDRDALNRRIDGVACKPSLIAWLLSLLGAGVFAWGWYLLTAGSGVQHSMANKPWTAGVAGILGFALTFVVLLTIFGRTFWVADSIAKEHDQDDLESLSPKGEDTSEPPIDDFDYPKEGSTHSREPSCV